MAKRFGKQVLRTKAEIKLDPMPADERKVMHQELSRFEHIKTEVMVKEKIDIWLFHM